MRKVFSFIFRQSVAIILLVIFVLGFGVYSTASMPINLLPDINVPMVCVQAVWAGAPAQSVETDVTQKLEEGLSSIGGVTSVSSYSYDNLSAVVLSFDYGTDTSKKQADITDKLSSLGLPDGISTDVYDIDLNAEALAVISITSPQGPDDAYAKGQRLAARVSAIDGVESVEVKGGPEYYYAVRPYGGLELLAPLLVEAFSYGGLDIPLGDVSADGGNVHIQNNSDIVKEEDIGNLPVTLPDGLCAMFAGIHGQIEGNSLLKAYGYDISDPQKAQELASGDLTIMGLNVFDYIKNTTNATLGSNLSDEVIRLIILNSFQGAEKTVRVADLATVTKEARYSGYVYYYGGTLTATPGITLHVYKANGANSAAVVKSIKAAYGELSAEEGFEASVTLLDDQSAFISDSISNVLISMVIGGLLAVIVIFLFLKKVKTSLIIAVTMPLSVLAAIICLSVMGITLNMVSLGGLAVGIGMLVDNSIVVIESISKHRDMDKTAFQAAVDGTCEVGGALFGSTLTTVCVFIPIIFSGGLTGEIFTDLSFAVIFSLVFSLIVAVTVIPALYAFMFREKRMLKGGRFKTQQAENSLSGAAAISSKGNTGATLTQNTPAEADSFAEAETDAGGAPGAKANKKGGGVMEKIASLYGKILPKVLGRKAVTIICAVAVFGASIGLLFLTGTEFLPSIDKGQLEVNMTYNSGVTLEEIRGDVWDFAQEIDDKFKDNIDYISVTVGKNGLLAFTDTGIIKVQLKTNRGTQNTVNAIRAMAEEQPNTLRAGVSVKEIDGVVASLMSGSDDLSVTITGDDNDELVRIAGEICEELKKPEYGFKDVKTSATEKAVRYNLRFDRQKLAAAGLDYSATVMTLRIGLSGYAACTVTIQGGDYNIEVSFDKSAVATLDDLQNFIIGYSVGESGTPAAVKLKDMLILDSDGNIPHEEVEACLRHTDGKRMVSVSGVLPGVDTGTAGDKMLAAAQSVLARPQNSGYSFSQSGITSYLNDAFRGLAVALVISFFLLYAVMAVQFSSAIKPLIIMASIPFSFTGGFLALVITGTSLNVVSFIGLIMLMGVVVNNAIVMLEKIKQLHNDGMPHYDAVCTACRVRLRPILMTTLTTILALIPLAIGLGQGSELMQPLGIVVIGGLLIGTLVTLALVPTVYCAVYGISKRRPQGRK